MTAEQQYFVRWGDKERLSSPVGIAAPVAGKGEIIRATTPTPTVWTLLLTATVEDAAGIAGISADVTFLITVGVGSASTSFVQVLTLTPLVLSAATQIPVLPASTLTVQTTMTPSAGPPAPLTITAAAMTAAFPPTSFRPPC